MPPVPKTQTSPPKTAFVQLSYPAPGVLLITMNKPKSLNAIDMKSHWEMQSVFEWLDAEPQLNVAIITGAGRAFCAGADLKEWSSGSDNPATRVMPPGGFGALSRRTGKKPVIAAVNGLCFGGGMEMVINCDLVVAHTKAQFGLPEVKRGVVAIQGAIPRLIRSVGRQRASELVLTGRTMLPEEALQWGLVNKVTDSDVIAAAVDFAQQISDNSPDSIIVSREALKLGWEGMGAEEATRIHIEREAKRLNEGENIQEGLAAFVSKRKPKWVPSKL